jgi:hypothetical protein
MVHENVGRLDVPVDDPLAVGIVQGIGHVLGNAHGVGHAELPLPVQLLPQRLSVDEGHDVVEKAVRLARVEEGQDVGVLEVRGRADFGQEPIGPDDRRQFRAQYLDGDLAVVANVVGEIDRGHAALAQLTLDALAALQGGVEAIDGLRAHRRIPPDLASRSLSQLWTHTNPELRPPTASIRNC